MANIKQIKVGSTIYNIEPYTKYLPLSGGQMTGNIQVPADGGGIMDTNNLTLVADTGSSITLGNHRNNISITNLKKLIAPTTSNGTTYGVGKGGQVLTTNGSTVYWGAQNVIDLGMITEDPTSTTNRVLNAAVTPGNLYKFTKLGYSADGFSQAYFMFVSAQFQGNSSTPAIYQLIKPGFDTSTIYVRIRSTSGTWSASTASLATEAQNFAAQKSAASGDTSSKLFLIGRTRQSSTGGTTYSHDTVYVDTDGHLYDSGNRVLTTADDVSGGGTVSGDYLPYYTVTLTNDTTPMSTVLSAYGNGLYAITFNGPSSGKYIFNVQHQGGTRYGMSAIDIDTNAISYYASEDMSTVTTADFKNSFTSFLKTTGGTITGDLTITYDSEGNGGSFYSSYIGMTDGEYSYGGWYADEGIYLGTGDEAQFYPYGLIFNGDNSSINLNGSNSNIFLQTGCGLVANEDGNAFGFDDAGYPTILNHDGRYLQIATDDLVGNYANYLFTEYSGFVPVTEEQGTSGQVLTSNGDGTYKWTAQTSGGGSTAQSVIDLGTITEDPASATNSVLNNITDNGIYVFKFYSSDDSITDCYIMTVNTEEYNDGTKDVHQQISNMGFSVIYYRDGYTGNSEWSCNLKDPQSMGSTTCSSNYDNKKLYLVGATSQAYEANTYSNKKIYIDSKNSLCSLSGGITVNKIWARTNNPDDYGYVAGSTGQVLKTNGTYVYWDTISTSGGGGTSSFTLLDNISVDLDSQRLAEFDLDYDPYKELFVYISTQDGAYELSDDFRNRVSCKEVAVMHLNYMSEDEMLLGTTTSDTGVSKPFISSNLRFFVESGSSIALNIKIYGR